MDFVKNIKGTGGGGGQFISNLKSALENKNVVTVKTVEELNAYRVAGPFSKVLFKSLKFLLLV